MENKKINIQFFGEEDDRQAKLENIFSTVNEVLKKVNTDDITSESSDTFSTLPDGYYFSELEKAELTESKTSGQPMVSWQFKTVENGIQIDEESSHLEIPKTANKKIFAFHVLKDASAIERFISDALKFEDEDGNTILEKEYFSTAELMSDALDILEGLRIWIHISTDKNNSTWTRFVSWKRAEKLELE
mgnify:CR=1 FL=1